MNSIRTLAALGILIAATCGANPAYAVDQATVVAACGAQTISNSQLGMGNGIYMDQTGKLCTAASVSASVSGFTPGGTFATITAAATSGSVALPAGTVVAFQNTGSATVSCTLGIGSAVALANEIQVPASSTVFVTVGSNTFGACIDQTGSTSNTVVLAGGSGLGTGFGGGGGGSSSNASVSATGSAVPASATYMGILSGGNLVGWDKSVTVASLPLPSGAATSANQTNGTQQSKITDGTNLATVKPASTAAATTDTSLVVQAIGLAQASTTSGQTGSLDMGAATAAAPSYTAGQTNPLSLTLAGRLRIDGAGASIGSDPSAGPGTPTEAFLALPATATTQIVALSGTKVTYVTLSKTIAGGTVNVTFKYGTGSNCGTGTATLEGPWPLTAQSGWVEGNGSGPVMIVPAGQALCVTTDASVGGGVKLVYQQF